MCYPPNWCAFSRSGALQFISFFKDPSRQNWAPTKPGVGTFEPWGLEWRLYLAAIFGGGGQVFVYSKIARPSNSVRIDSFTHFQGFQNTELPTLLMIFLTFFFGTKLRLAAIIQLTKPSFKWSAYLHPQKIGDGTLGARQTFQGPRKVGFPGRFEGATDFWGSLAPMVI